MTSQQNIIYGLVDPRTHLVFYVGESTTGMRRPRYHAYASEKRNPAKLAIINDLKSRGLGYEIAILEVVDAPGERAVAPYWLNAGRNPTALHEAERYWIAYGRACGWPLTNIAEGGEGVMRGRKHSPEARAKMSAALRGRKGAPHTPEARAKISAAHRGKTLSPEHCAQMSETRRGRKQPPRTDEHRANLSASLRGREHSPESRARMSAAHTGKRHTPETRARMREAHRRNRELRRSLQPTPTTHP